MLTSTIGTLEHSGCVRGMSSTLTWGKALCEEQASYRKCDHDEKDLETKMRKIVKQELIEFFITQQASSGPIAENAISSGHGQGFKTCSLPKLEFLFLVALGLL